MDEAENWISELVTRVTGYQTRFSVDLPGPLGINHDDRIIVFHSGLSPQALALVVLVAFAEVLFAWSPMGVPA